MVYVKGMAVESTIGKLNIDSEGSPVAVTRMDPAQAYVGVPELLQKFINESDAEAWEKIKKKIDYIYANLDQALGRLNEEASFSEEIRTRVKAGKKLLFKPNLVNPQSIDPATHGEALANTACTSWPFIAALMRWFHDKLDITYYEMALAEAASVTSIMSGAYTRNNPDGRTITTEAVMEGRSGDFYGGWGFYFVRKYLSEKHQESHKDEPMNGYEESISGRYLTPGRANNKLMGYDLNRLYDMKSKGREVPVPDGANYQDITLHKAIVGGDPENPEDMKDYPGCVLVNVPRLKLHAIDLLTNAIKNLGIGLYPMEVAVDDDPQSTRWKYSFPFKQFPGMKTEIPHTVWIPRMDDETGLPVKNEKGEYVVTKTAGMSGTQADVIRATENQGVYMLHVVDAIEAVNIDHQGTGAGVKIPEGYALASLDPVALDLLCARYCCKTVPMLEARKIQKEENLPTDFMRRVPVPKSDGQSIISEEGFDSPLFRYNLYNYAESRGLGKQSYYVVGWDSTAGAPLASLEGHLGRIEDGARFTELMTSQIYFALMCMLWDLQSTVMNYMKANDNLTGSSYFQELMDTFDEDGDGVITYDETGKNGPMAAALRLTTVGMRLMAVEKYGFLHGPFLFRVATLKYSDEKWNPQGHDFLKMYRLATAAAVAFMMSQVEMESPDLLFPNITWGKGKWPSIQFAGYASVANSIYGLGFPTSIDLVSLYGQAFQYADKALNGGSYTGSTETNSDPEAINNYFKAVSEGATPLDFVLYVPVGFGNLAGNTLPNIEETGDPNKILTAHFNSGKEIWQ